MIISVTDDVQSPQRPFIVFDSSLVPDHLLLDPGYVKWDWFEQNRLSLPTVDLASALAQGQYGAVILMNNPIVIGAKLSIARDYASVRKVPLK
jgi:hypothetical protein